MNYKTCTKCKEVLEATSDNFPKAKKGKYGFYASCKKCKNKTYSNMEEKNEERKNKRLKKLDELGYDISSLNHYPEYYEFIDIKCKSGHELNNCFNYMLKSSGCSVCKTLKPYFEISEILIKEGFTILTKEEDFKGSSFTKIKYICPSGHESESACSSIRRGNRCLICSYDIIRKIHRNELEDIIEFVKSIGYNYNFVVGKYENSNNKINITCDKNHTSEMAINNLKAGYRCNRCGFDRISGENHYLWKNGISKLNNHLRSTTLKWKMDSFRESNYTCFITGVRGGCNLVVHHATNFSDIVLETLNDLKVDTRHTISEYSDDTLREIEELCLKKHYEYGLGVVMTEKIHKLYHSTYGIKTIHTIKF